MNSLSRSSKGFLIALVGTLLWSTTGPLISYIVVRYSLPSLVLAFWRDLFVALGMCAGLALFSRARFFLARANWRFMMGYGFALAVFNSMWTLSVQYNGAAVATVMAFSSPAMTAVLSYFLLKERFNALKVFSIVLSLGGIALVSGAYDPAAWNLNPLGIVFGLLSGLLFAVYNLEGKYASDRGIDSWTALLYSFAWATVFLLFFVVGVNLLAEQPAFFGLTRLGTSLSGWSWLFFLAVAPTLGGFGFYTLSIRYLSPTVSNLIATLEPAFTGAWAYLFLGERLTTMQIFGSGLLLVGVALLRIKGGDSAEGMESP